MISYIFIAMLLSLIGWILTLFDNGKHNFPYGFVGGMVGVIIPLVFLIHFVETTPTALDVYKGKTTLEITYRDSIPVDSIVVFKNK